MTQEKGGSLERFMAAFGANDIGLLKTMIDPDFENPQSRALPYGGKSYRGWDGFEEFGLGIWQTTWNLDTFDLVRTFVEPGTEPGIESIVVELHVAGTSAATGEPFDTTIMEHWIFRDGRLSYAKPHWYEPPVKR